MRKVFVVFTVITIVLASGLAVRAEETGPPYQHADSHGNSYGPTFGTAQASHTENADRTTGRVSSTVEASTDEGSLRIGGSSAYSYAWVSHSFAVGPGEYLVGVTLDDLQGTASRVGSGSGSASARVVAEYCSNTGYYSCDGSSRYIDLANCYSGECTSTTSSRRTTHMIVGAAEALGIITVSAFVYTGAYAGGALLDLGASTGSASASALLEKVEVAALE